MLLMKVFEDLPEDYVVFYINFRGLDVERVEDLIRVLFAVEYSKGKEAIKEIVREIVKEGSKVLKKAKGIPIPEKVFDYLFESKRKTEDAFRYLENLFSEVVEGGKRPILVIDELQVIKKVINATGQLVLNRLFNFMIRLTKETHLCHCLCATSDCLFIEDVYSNARLEGRAEYLIVDDLDKEEAYSVYEGFGFEDKELVWDYIGGKIGDMVSLFEEKKRGLSEKEALERMFKDTKNKLEWIKLMKLRKREDGNDLWKFLELFKKADFVSKNKIEEDFEKFLFWIEENVLFYNHVEGTVRLQSRLLWRVIREVMSSI
ncbi:MAG: ATP-binding protein [Deltaproteobacteria bacterium]|nr:MAG: ATP-binding protein [Deltaproteobacteria bacterium]